MYQNWFLDYASYVILERAVPHINDVLKPVQRRILHSMKRLDDGRYNKVANIVGHTMQFHPHGEDVYKRQVPCSLFCKLMKKEGVRKVKCTPKVRQKTFGVHFIIDATPVYLYYTI